jgi:hypothetical protein
VTGQKRPIFYSFQKALVKDPHMHCSLHLLARASSRHLEASYILLETFLTGHLFWSWSQSSSAWYIVFAGQAFIVR